jgi:site-specific recombinase XerC
MACVAPNHDVFDKDYANDNTRMAYYRAVCSFFAGLAQHGIGGLVDIEPFHVAAYIKALKVSAAGNPAVKERAAAKPTVKQHLAAIRMLFDWLIVGQVLAINPAHAVRGPKHVINRGKTPVLTEDQARRPLASIKVVRKVTRPDGTEGEEPWLVGLRDRALIGVMMTYTFARISAVVAMQVEDYFPNGKPWWVRLQEKGGKRHEMPAHHKLEDGLPRRCDSAELKMKGLVIDEPWISLIISGQKTWEMRSRNTLVRGRIALIRKGSKTVIGTADLVRTLPKLSPAELKAGVDNHRVPESEIVKEFKHNTAWVLQRARPLREPIPYRHPAGAVIWVNLDPEVAAMVEKRSAVG